MRCKMLIERAPHTPPTLVPDGAQAAFVCRCEGGVILKFRVATEGEGLKRPQRIAFEPSAVKSHHFPTDSALRMNDEASKRPMLF